MDVPYKLKHVTQRAANRLGYRVERRYPADFPPELVRLIQRVQPYTLTPPERIAAAVEATEYVVRNRLPGAFVECGVWKGGSMMAIALTLLRLGAGDRELYLLDTFAGMPAPGDEDVRLDGLRAAERWKPAAPGEIKPWAGVPRSEVEQALASTGYDPARLHYVEGRVEETLPASAPASIALLRLDTDWYASTKHELVHLFPRLEIRGVLIIDDYGHFQGARKAADEYFAERRVPILLCRIDYSARIAVKQSAS